MTINFPHEDNGSRCECTQELKVLLFDLPMKAIEAASVGLEAASLGSGYNAPARWLESQHVLLVWVPTDEIASSRSPVRAPVPG